MEPGWILAQRFRVLERVARGGMGSVYHAEDLTDGGSVALKLLDGPRSDAGERFAREASVLASLTHPAIVGYVAHGREPGGDAWLAMQWLQGEPLSARLARGPLPPAVAIALVRRVAEALGEAHAAGVVHRDVKPSNLFLVEGDPARVVVLDFGIARRLDPADDVTEPGVVVGTWSYMAPEQAVARETVDARADVFALGCVLFECLTGRKAFMAGQRTTVLAKILLEDPPAPSELARHLPAEVDRLVARFLSKSREERPRNGRDVYRALLALGDVSSLPPRPRSSLPPSMGDAERRVISIVLARGVIESDATVSETGAGSAEASLCTAIGAGVSETYFLANGTALVVSSVRELPMDGALSAARRALALVALRAEAAVAVATGFGVVTGRQPVGVVIERGVELLRRATPGDVLVDSTSAELLASRCVLRAEAGSMRLLAERDAIDVSRRLLGRRTPFMGRETELATLAQVVRRSIEGPRSRVSVVRGAPGVGKSRLSLEVVSAFEQLAPDGLVLFARCDSVAAGSPLSLVARLVRRWAGIATGESVATHQGKLRDLTREMRSPDEARRAALFLGELLGAPFASGTSPLLDAARADVRLMNDVLRGALLDLLAAHLARRPVFVVLDDMQWGDEPSITLMDDALTRFGDRPLSVLALERPGTADASRPLFTRHEPVHIELGPLAARAAQRLLRSALGPKVDPQLVTRIMGLAQGNAFFLEELVRTAADRRSIASAETVVGTVQATLDALGPEARRVLRAASVFGERFSEAGVKALLAADAGAQVSSILRDLVAREVLLEGTSGTLEGGSELAFRHALLRDAAYAWLTDTDRALGHRLAAEWLESRPGVDPLVIARHHALGRKPGKAIAWYERGAAQALAGNDYVAAVRICKLALDAGARGAQRGALLVLDAQARRFGNDQQAAYDSATRALRVLSRGSAPWYEALREAAMTAANTSRFGDSLRYLQRALETPPIPGAEAVRAVTLLRSAAAALEGVSHRQVRALLESAPEVAALAAGDAHVRAWWHNCHSLLAHCAGDTLEYLKETRLGAEAQQELGDLRSACLMQMNLGYGLAEVGDFAGADAQLRASMKAAGELGLTRTVAYARHNLGYALHGAGKLDLACEVESRAVEDGVNLKAAALEVASRCYLSAILLDLGDAQRALEQAERASALAEQRTVVTMAQATLARACVATGDLARALELARAAWAPFAAGSGFGEQESLVRLALCEALAALGRHEDAALESSSAREWLLARSTRITDAELRRAFLHAVPHHRRLLELAATLVDAP